MSRVLGARSRLLVGLVAAAVVAMGLTIPSQTEAAAATASCVDSAWSEAAALETARACGRLVEVSSSTSEIARRSVKPSGEFVWEQHVTPVRVRRGSGWTPVDTSLTRQADGSLAPLATTVQLRFSSGGDGPLVVFSVGGGSVTLRWPGRLPSPTVVGDTAVYAEVLPGVDLRVRATAAGFTQVLVVKDRSAAANPALTRIRYGLSALGLTVSDSGDGGIRIVDSSRKVVAAAPPGLMWDSGRAGAGSAGASAGVAQDAGGQAEPSTPETPGDAARVAAVTAAVSGSDLVVTPDPSLLNAPDAVFPLYVDPAFNAAQQRWAYARSTNTNNNDGVARVGASPDGSGTYRSFFQFGLGPDIAYRTITGATFSTTLTHSSSCSDTPVSLWFTGDIPGGVTNGTRTTWSPPLTSWLDERWGRANKSACPQPDKHMEFSGSLPGKVQEWVNMNWGLVTLGLSTRNSAGNGESNSDNWKKFRPEDTKLTIEYNTTPYTPTAAQLSTHADYTASAQACVTGASRPLNRSLTPYLKATLTDPDGVNGPNSGKLSGEFSVQKWNGSSWAGLSGWPKSVSNVTPGAKGEIQIMTGLAEANMVRWQVRTIDGGGLSSGWSPWCEFTVDAAPPSAKPTVSSADGIYQEKTVHPAAQGSIGRSGRFTFGANGIPDIKRYVYRFDNGPEITVDAVDSSGVPTLGGTATVTVTPTHAAENVITVRSVDQGGNSSANYDYGFIVDVLSGPVAHWQMNEASGATLNSAVAGGPTATLINGGSRVDGRLLGTHAQNGADKAVLFDGVDDYAAPASSPIDTSRSFSVGAWVRLENKDANGVVLSKQGGVNYASFYLSYKQSVDRWQFEMPTSSDSGTPGFAWHTARSTSVPQAGVWTHLAGTFDPAARTLKLYVNGVLEATAAGVVAWDYASGQFRIGKSGATWWPGELDDVRVWNRVLDPVADLKPLMQPVNVGAWDFEDCGGFTSTDDSGYQRHGTFSHDPDDPGSPVQTSYDGYNFSCAAGFDGTAGAVTTAARVLRTDQSFTVAAYVWLDAMPGNAMTAVAQDGQWRSGFYLGIRTVGADVSWSFTMPDEDSDPNQGGSTAGVTASTPIDSGLVGTWVHLIGVYDASAGKTRLYVNGVKVQEQTRTARWSAQGVWSIGRAKWTVPDGVPTDVDWWAGVIDRVWAHSGAMSDAEVTAFYGQMRS